MLPHTSAVVQASQFVPVNETFGVRVQADKTVTADMIVRRAGKAPYSLTGTRQLATTTYLAGGTTSGTFREIVYLLNPQPAAVTARIRVVPVGTAKARTLRVSVPANRTAAYELNRLYPGQSISAIVEAGSPLAVSRVLTFGPRLYGANAAAGAVQPQKQWVFPTASVAAGARTALTIYNPSSSKKATLTLTMYDENGVRLFIHTERVPAKQHLDIDLNSTLLGTAVMTRTAGFQLTASSSVPLFIERSFYAGPPDTARVASSFLTSPPLATSWSFAGGETTTGISETLTIVNPGKTLASVHLTFIRANGTTVPLDLALLAGARTTVDVASQVPSLGPSMHGVHVMSKNRQALAVEEGETGGGATAGYNTFGLTP